MSIAAVIPVGNMVAANTALQSAGHGPINFSVAAFGGGNPTHACLHAWGGAALIAAVKAQAGVVWNEGVSDPSARLQALLTTAGAQWGDRAPNLPSTGNALANTLYRFGDELWWCIQTFDRTTFNLHPSTYPALIRKSRRPGEISAWEQPLDQFSAYLLLNPFTGQPDRAIDAGQIWRVSQASGTGGPQGDFNTFRPGAFGWTSEGAA